MSIFTFLSFRMLIYLCCLCVFFNVSAWFCLSAASDGDCFLFSALFLMDPCINCPSSVTMFRCNQLQMNSGEDEQRSFCNNIWTQLPSITWTKTLRQVWLYSGFRQDVCWISLSFHSIECFLAFMLFFCVLSAFLLPCHAFPFALSFLVCSVFSFFLCVWLSGLVLQWYSCRLFHVCLGASFFHDLFCCIWFCASTTGKKEGSLGAEWDSGDLLWTMIRLENFFCFFCQQSDTPVTVPFPNALPKFWSCNRFHITFLNSCPTNVNGMIITVCFTESGTEIAAGDRFQRHVSSALNVALGEPPARTSQETRSWKYRSQLGFGSSLQQGSASCSWHCSKCKSSLDCGCQWKTWAVILLGTVWGELSVKMIF